jgi:hypothetical protein
MNRKSSGLALTSSGSRICSTTGRSLGQHSRRSVLRLSRRGFKSFDDWLGLRRRGGLRFSQSGSFFSLAQQEFQLPGIELLAFDSEDPANEQIDFFFEQRVFALQQIILRL